MSENPSENIEKVSKATKKKIADVDNQDLTRLPPDAGRFDDALQAAKVKGPEKTDPQLKASLMDEIRALHRRTDSVTKATPIELAEKSKKLIARIDDVKDKLKTPDLELKRSVQSILRNKLEHIDENLKVAFDKAGLEYTRPAETDVTASTPIEKFLDLLTDGQTKLNSLSNHLEQLHLNKENLTPASALAIQVKVGHMQQEIEFFTSLLNKALESIKTVMNVQV